MAIALGTAITFIACSDDDDPCDGLSEAECELLDEAL